MQSKILKKIKLDLLHFWYTYEPRTKPWISSLSSGLQPNVTSILNSLGPNTPSGNKVWFNLACTHPLATFFTASVLMFSYTTSEIPSQTKAHLNLISAILLYCWINWINYFRFYHSKENIIIVLFCSSLQIYLGQYCCLIEAYKNIFNFIPHIMQY